MTTNSINSVNPLIQMIESSSTSVQTINAQIPRDNTIPQNTEGVEIITATITPISSTSTLFIEFFTQFACVLGPPASSSCASALFQDSTVNALAAVDVRPRTAGTSDGNGAAVLNFAMTSGTTSSTTFKIRMGTNNGVIAYTNADASGTRVMGGASSTLLTIKEFL